MSQAEPMVTELQKFVSLNDPAQPLESHMCSAQAFGNATASLMPIVSSGSPPDTAELFEKMVLNVLME
eukprot:4188479-Pyramimonas_sp.AAC.1